MLPIKATFFESKKMSEKINNLVSAILDQPRGVDRKIIQQRPAKIRAAYKGINLVKRSTVFGRFVNYEAQKSTKIARENGREEIPNNWTSHQEDCEGLFTDKKGVLKVCIGHAMNKNLRGKSEYLLNGKTVTLESVATMLLASETTKKEIVPDWYTLKAENLISIDDIEI